jgi:hypothetical protein
MSGLEAIVGLVVAATVVVFAFGFRFGKTQMRARDAVRAHALPRAFVASGDARWTAGQGRQRWLDRVPTFQAALVAVGVTSIFLMTLCFVAMVVVAVVGS